MPLERHRAGDDGRNTIGVIASQLIAKVAVQGSDQVKRELLDIAHSMNETQETSKKTQSVFGDFLKSQFVFNAVTSSIGFLKDQIGDSIQLAMQHQDVMEQTAKVLKSTHDASGMTAQSLQDLAASLEKTTFFSKDQTEAGENLLLTFTGIGKDVFPLATKTMLDMSKAMGQDVKSTAIMMGKALNDPATGLTALTRVGVTFTDQQKSMIQQMVAAGDTAGAQKIMLQELQREFGGSADATTTAAGRMQIFKDRIDDLKERIGAGLLPILTGLMDHVASPALDLAEGLFHKLGDAVHYVGEVLETVNLRDFSAAWQSVKSAVHDVAQDFGEFGAKLHPVAVDFDPLADKIQSLASGALSLLSKALGDAYVALSGVDGIFHKGKGPVEDFLNSLKPLVSSFKDVASSAFNLIGPALSLYGAISPLHLVFAEAGSIISQVLPPALDIGKQVFDGLKGVISSVSPVIEDDLEPAIQNLASAIIPIVAGIVSWIDKSGIIKIALGALKDVIPPLVVGISNVVNGLTSVVKFFTQTQVGSDLLKAALITLGIGFGVMAVQGIIAFIATVPAMVGGFLASAGAAWGLAVAVIAFTWPILAAVAVIALIILAVQHWSDIVNALKIAWSGVSGFFGGIVNDVKGFFAGIGPWFHDRFTEAYNGIKDALGAVGGWVHDHLVAPFEDGLGRIGGVFSAIAKLISDATALNFGAIPGDLHSLGIPGFASGTSYAPGGWGIVGEQGPEAMYIPRGAQIFPASQTAQMLGGSAASSGAGQPIILQIDGHTFARITLPYTVSQIRNAVGIRSM